MSTREILARSLVALVLTVGLIYGFTVFLRELARALGVW